MLRSVIAVPGPRALTARVISSALISSALIGSVFTTAFTSSAHAQAVPGEAVSEVDPIDIPPEHDPLAHAWDQPGDRGGFYLRLSTSIGVNNTRLGEPSWDGDGVTANGFGTAFGLDAGGFVAPWLALHLDATIGMLWHGNLNVDDTLAAAGVSDETTRIAAYGLAPAATFFTPHDFYLKTAL